MNMLATAQCLPCSGGVAPYTEIEASGRLGEVPGWSLCQSGRELVRKFTFTDDLQALSFVNAVGWIAHQQDHHPVLQVSFNRCTVRYSTHAVGGLSENDFICAARINQLVEDRCEIDTGDTCH